MGLMGVRPREGAALGVGESEAVSGRVTPGVLVMATKPQVLEA